MISSACPDCLTDFTLLFAFSLPPECSPLPHQDRCHNLSRGCLCCARCKKKGGVLALVFKIRYVVGSEKCLLATLYLPYLAVLEFHAPCWGGIIGYYPHCPCSHGYCVLYSCVLYSASGCMCKGVKVLETTEQDYCVILGTVDVMSLEDCFRCL